jgi:hypothetical protein
MYIKVFWDVILSDKLTDNLGETMLIIVQRDVTQSSLFIILQVHSTCFGCQTHPSSGVHKTVTTASGTGRIFVQLPLSNVENTPVIRSTQNCNYSIL